MDRLAEACRTAGFPIDGLPAPEDAAAAGDGSDDGSGPAGQAIEEPVPDEGADGFTRSEEAVDAVRPTWP